MGFLEVMKDGMAQRLPMLMYGIEELILSGRMILQSEKDLFHVVGAKLTKDVFE